MSIIATSRDAGSMRFRSRVLPGGGGRKASPSLARPGSQSLERLLLLVHEGVRPVEDVAQLRIVTCAVVRKAAGHDGLSAFDVGDAEVVERLHEGMAVLEVDAPQEDDEFVAAHAVHGAVGEDVADHIAGPADVLVPCLLVLRS